MKTIQKRDLIEALKPFGDSDYVRVKPNIENSVTDVEFATAEKAVKKIELALEEWDLQEGRYDQELATPKELRAYLKRIAQAMDDFAPIWEDVSQSDSHLCDIAGVEVKNDGTYGRHAVII